MDVYSLQKLMGHADLQVLRRYLRQTDADLQEAHLKKQPGRQDERGRSGRPVGKLVIAIRLRLSKE